MKVTRRPRRQGPLIHALYLNAGLLLAIVVVLLARGNGPGLATPALGAPQMPPIAGGGGVFLMPAQFSTYTWGCYLLDIDSQNICAYQYFPSDRQLRFVAARNYREDRKIKDWNTFPHPAEVAHLVEQEQAPRRGAPAQDNREPVPDNPPIPDNPVPPAIPTTQPITTTHPWSDELPANTPGDSTRPTNDKTPAQPATQPAAAGH